MNENIVVSFPNMGLDINVSRVAFKVINTPIYWYGIIIALAFLVCVLWAMRDTRKFDLVPETIIDLMLFAAPAAIICARLYYVIFSWDNYKYDLKEIINTRNGGLAVLGGIIGAVITAYFVARYKKIPVLKLFDFAVPYIALGQAIGRWGNFFNQEAFGTNTNLPWGMTSPVVKNYLSNNAQLLQSNGITVNPELPVHPTFLYESIWDIAVFAFLLWLRKKKKFNGEVFCMYFVTYSLGRAFIEGMRTDSLMLGNIRITQLLSVVFFIIFGIFIIYKRIKIKNSTEDVEIGQSGYGSILKVMEEEESREAAARAAESGNAGSGNGTLDTDATDSETTAADNGEVNIDDFFDETEQENENEDTEKNVRNGE